MTKRKKSLSYQLINTFNSSFEYSYINNFIPDLSQIEKLLEDNKDKIGFHDSLRKFLAFLNDMSYSETDVLSYDNETIFTGILSGLPYSETALAFDCRPIIGGKSAETFNKLFKKIKNLLTSHENKVQLRNCDLFQNSIFNTVKLGFKMLIGISLLDSVLGRPVPGEQNFLKKIMESKFDNWSQYYDDISEILHELETEIKKGNLSYAIKQKIFWFFRNYLDHPEKNITPEQNQKLYNIIEKTLKQQNSELLLLEADHLSILEDIFIILRTLYPYSDKDIKIFNIYIDRAIQDKSLSKTKNADKFVTQLFNTFKNYLPTTLTDGKLHLIKPLQRLINVHLIWNEKDPVAMLLKALFFLKDIRKQYKINRDVTNNIDQYAKTICESAIVKIPNAYHLPYPKIWIEEDIGAAYIKYLEPSERLLFDGLYKILTPKDVLPYAETQFLKGIKDAPNFRVTINYDKLSPEKKEQAFKLAKEAYRDIESLKSKFNLVSVQKQPIHISINLFNNVYHFERYGYLVFNYDSSGGGICDDFEELCRPNIYQTFTGFLNFKHEVIHALMQHFLGKNYRNYVSGAFCEGIADWFDKGPLNLNEMNWLDAQFNRVKRKYLAEVALKELPEVVTLNEGGSIVYSWGYFWLKFMLEEDNSKDVRPIFYAIQTGDKKFINSTITHYANNKKEWFNEWLKKLKGTYTRPSLDIDQVQNEYLQFLENNLDFAYLIKNNNGQIRFEFADGYVYTLETEKISCSYIYRNSDKSVNRETLKQLDYSHYEWFKKKLLDDVIGLSTEDASLSSVNVPQDEIYLKEIIKFLSNQVLDPRKRKLLEGIILNYAQKIYRQDLNSNPELWNFLLQDTITFEFANSVFVLSTRGISRYSNNRLETAQSIYVSDYRWFKSALEIFVMEKQLENSSTDRNFVISNLLHINKDYVADRVLKNVNPGMSNNLQRLIENFVFHSPSGLSVAFKNCFGQKAINIDTLRQIIDEQVGEFSAKPSNRFPTTVNPLLLTSLAVNATNLLLNVTGANNPVLTNNNSPEAHDSNVPNWVTPVIATLSVVTIVATGISFWCWKKSKTSNKKTDATSNCKKLTTPLMFQQGISTFSQKEEGIPDAKCSASRQSRFW